METTEHPTEGDPLKREEDGAETTKAPSATELKKKSCKDALGLSKLTHWRTAVFFLSLFLCLTIVFAFSFIIPCPVRSQYLSTWNRTFSEAGTYDFLAIEHANSDKVMDFLFAIKNREGTQNKSCADAGLPSPCVFVVAVDGTNGETLWEKPLDSDFNWAQCGLGKEKGPWHCLLSHSDNLTAINKYKGHVIWQQPQPTGLQSSMPVLSVPDLDGDSVNEVVLVASGSTQTQVAFLSGKTGAQIGSTVVLDFKDTSSHLLHITTEGSDYILLQKDTGVYGLALWKIAAEAKEGLDAKLKKDKQMEKNANPATGLIPIYESETVKMIRIKEADDSSDLLVLSRKEVALLDGKQLQLQWRFNTSSVLGDPSYGHFNEDEILDVVLEQDMGNNTKKILILDGKSGGVLWKANLLVTKKALRPASVYTINYLSIFMFWGLMPSENNSSDSLAGNQRSYLLYPRYSKVLLESADVVDDIITFKATLMESGRHAAYILLMGPAVEGSEGTVVLVKRKLKNDVPSSRVLRIGPGGDSDTNNDIKEAFKQLRFSDY